MQCLQAEGGGGVGEQDREGVLGVHQELGVVVPLLQTVLRVETHDR